MRSHHAYAHQEWIFRATWGPMTAAALALIADGRIDLDALSHHAAAAGRHLWALDESGTIHRDSPFEPIAAACLMATAG